MTRRRPPAPRRMPSLSGMYPFGDTSPLTRFVIGLDEALRGYRGDAETPLSRGAGRSSDPWNEDLFFPHLLVPPTTIVPGQGDPKAMGPDLPQTTRPVGARGEADRSGKLRGASSVSTERIGAGFMSLAGLLATTRLRPVTGWYRGPARTQPRDRFAPPPRARDALRPMSSGGSCTRERSISVAASAADEPWVQVTGSPRLWSWLAEHQVSLAFTTYQTGKLFLLGRHPEGRLAVFERTFNRAMGLWADGQTLWLSTLYQLWRFENLLQPGELLSGPRPALRAQGRLHHGRSRHPRRRRRPHRPALVRRHRFRLRRHAGRSVELHAPLVAAIPEQADRGGPLPLERAGAGQRRPRYATAVSSSDVIDGWRDRRKDGGVVLEIPSGRVIASGLSMPHSPRLYRGRLWLHNSGTGHFGSIDLASGRFEPLDLLPGLPARTGLRRRSRRRRAVSTARRPDFQRLGA